MSLKEQVEQSKAELMSACKKAETARERTKAVYKEKQENGELTDENEINAFHAKNAYGLRGAYAQYLARTECYREVLKAHDESAAKEWQNAKDKAYRDVSDRYLAEGRTPWGLFECNWFVYYPDE